MVRNFILNSLGDREYSLLSRHLELVSFEAGQVLYEPHIPIKRVYFLIAGLACTFTMMKNGFMVANNIGGREGLLPLPIFLESGDMPLATTVMTVAGGAFTAEISFLRRHMGELKRLTPILSRFAMVQMVQLMQNAACGRLHDLEERLACWLLMINDRVGGDFKITHEMIAEMLGSRRATVTMHAEAMQRNGMIKYGYGRMQIVSRTRLQQVACECYKIHHHTYTNYLKLKLH